ncbi:PP2C family serine/threonine-protein phosphatase, partial [Mycobacterium sp. 1465703.0]|uniref:PP2C family protein-serine/threonine phosphatase n=1 Tax=Mycobacterium sp. 1465703.0 TaxID=1834078 RepID=UPI0008013A35
RSLIMRALTGHEVEPTLIMREARAGDRYLLCSDGLSDPVSDETILEALQIPDVAEAAYRLIELALRGGGPDNVTVVVADVVDYDYGQTQPILAGAVSGDEDQMTLPNTSAGRASAIRPRDESAKRVAPQPETTGRPRWSRRKMFVAVALAVLLVFAGLTVGWWVIQRNYYVAEYSGRVSIVRGIQGTLLGIPLQEPYLVGCLNGRNELSLISYGQSSSHANCQPMTLKDLRRPGQVQVQTGLPGGSLDQAESQLRQLLAEYLLPICPPPRATSPPGSPGTRSGTPESGTTAAPAPPNTSPSASPSPSTSANGPANSAPAGPTTTSQTVTALPGPPLQPGIDCRTVA